MTKMEVYQKEVEQLLIQISNNSITLDDAIKNFYNIPLDDIIKDANLEGYLSGKAENDDSLIFIYK